MSIQRRTCALPPKPASLHRLSAAALVLGLGVLLLVGPLAPSASAATPVPAFDSTFATLLNTLRSTLGLSSFAVDPQLSSVARAWSTNMATSSTLSHNPALTSQVQGWSKVGENVGTGSAVTQVFDALVASPPHMKNMSDPAFSRIGVATVTDSRNRLWTTHVFMRPMAAGAAPAARPAAPPATQAPAPATTRAPKPVPTTATPATTPPAPPAVAPTTAAQVPTAPVAVAAAGAVAATEAAQPAGDQALVSARPGSRPRPNLPLVLGAGLLALLVVSGAGILLRRATGRSAGGSASAGRHHQPVEQQSEDLTKVLDLLHR